MSDHGPPIPGTTIFDGGLAVKGYELNRLCYALNDAGERAAFAADETGFYDRFELSSEQLEALRERDILGLIAAGGNIYYLAKLAGCLGLNVQDIGAQQTGVSVDEFKAKLLAAGEH